MPCKSSCAIVYRSQSKAFDVEHLFVSLFCLSCSRSTLLWGLTSLNIKLQPNREDEYERIEAAGGRVIDWGGYRVSGVLGMSRSIGTSLFNVLESFVLFHLHVTLS